MTLQALAESALTHIASAVPQASTSIRVNGRDVIGGVVCPALRFSRGNSEQGTYLPATITAMVTSANETTRAALIVGAVIELYDTRKSKWVKLRISERSDISGIVQIKMESQFE